MVFVLFFGSYNDCVCKGSPVIFCRGVMGGVVVCRSVMISAGALHCVIVECKLSCSCSCFGYRLLVLCCMFFIDFDLRKMEKQPFDLFCLVSKLVADVEKKGLCVV